MGNWLDNSRQRARRSLATLRHRGLSTVVGVLLAQFADTALALQPERAAVHALGAWGRFLIEPDDPAVRSGMQLAAELAKEDERYEELAQAFRGPDPLAELRRRPRPLHLQVN